MKTSLSILSLLAMLVLMTALMTEQPATVADRSAARGAAPGFAGVDRAGTTPLQREITAVVDSARAAEARLLAELGDAAAPDHPAVRRHRRETTVRLLEIQARHAAARGQFRLERRIRANLAVLRTRPMVEPASASTLARRDG